MKRYFTILSFILLFSNCEKEAPIEPQVSEIDEKVETKGLPVLVTNPIEDLTRYSVKITGYLTDTGDSEVIETGFVVDTAQSPTIEENLNKFVIEPDEDGFMIVIPTNIPPNLEFYIRSYAINQQGIGYGNEVQFTSLSHKIYEGNVTLSTQEEVIEFGEGKYTTIDGSLEITGTVTDLSPLNNLAVINYAFNLRNTTHLATMKGMDSLEAINAAYFFHGIAIENNSALTSLEGLEKLTRNNGDFWIINNDLITNFEGLNNLSFNHFGELRIQGCEMLRNLHGLEKFQWLDGDIIIKDNTVLEDISAFRSLNFITGRIRILNNQALQNLEGFESLHSVEGIELHDNILLSDLKGLSNLDTITSVIFIRNNALRDLSGFEKVKSTEYLTIENSPDLTSLKGLENLEQVQYKVEIDNTGLINLSGLESLKQTARLYLRSNKNLINLLGLTNLTTLADSPYSLSVTSNNQLNSLEGLDNLTKAEGQIFIGNNQILDDFCALKPLLKANGSGGSFIVEGNADNPTVENIINNCP